MNQGGPIGHEEGNQFRDLVAAAESANQDAAKRVHQALTGGVPVGPGLFRELGDQAIGGRRLDDPGRDRVDADALRADFLRQPLV